MGLKSKTVKGEISTSNNNGRIRLRWRYAGERYSLNLPYAYLPENLHYASIKAAEIRLDIIKGVFDCTLQKYEPTLPNPSAAIPEKLPAQITALKAGFFLIDLVDYFNDWGKCIRNVDVDNAVDYLYVRRLFEKWDKVPINEIARQLNAENWAITTYNRRLTCLQHFLGWLMESGIISNNPLKEVRRKRSKKKVKKSRRLPFTEQEIFTLLTAIKENTYCPTASRFKHSHYYPFLFFIFNTGVRNAEAIGLRAKHVDLQNLRVEIIETFARTLKGTNHAARITKGTKTENTRFIPLTDELVEILRKQIEGRQSDDFVFPSPKGLSIDDKMFQRRILKPVLRKLKLGDRDLYAARHSFGTRAAKQGIPITDIAYLMGHTTINTAIRNYISVSAASHVLPALKAS